MPKLFGTDGIRGIANQYPITAEMGFSLGFAIVRYCKLRKIQSNIIIGRDTRASGESLESAIVSGIKSAGGIVQSLGVIPTPGVAFFTRTTSAGAGIVISASHNPYEYNGFKIFSKEGYKLSVNEEDEIEDLLGSADHPPKEDRGRPQEEIVSSEEYGKFLKQTLPKGLSLKDMKIVIDCSNGATFKIAPALFESLGAQAKCLFIDPDGRNINQHCGSQHPEALSQRVVETHAAIGLAFDGDGDRLVAIDENGESLTGDQILAICAKMLEARGELKNRLVVSTVMSNLGLGIALKRHGIGHVMTQVGDRYVTELMRAREASLGGEESGHIVFLNYHTTGDGLLTALQLLSAMKIFGKPLSELANWMTVFPQTLLNVPVQKKPDISAVPEISRVIQETESRLGDKGRVLVRYSGTEPLCRIMVEGETREEIEDHAQGIAAIVKQALS